MGNTLFIQFPEDFEKKYQEYKARILGLEKQDLYSSRKEGTKLANLDIEISDKYILYKGKDKKTINPTDKKIVDYLHYRFKEEKGLRIPPEKLASEFGKTPSYIDNRIVIINKHIRELVSGNNKTNIDSFIKNEPKRGYYLNPRFVIKFTRI